MANRMRAALAAGLFVACGSEQSEPPAPIVHDAPVIQQVLVEYDGRELTFRTLRPGELEDVLHDEVGAGRQPLVELDSYACSTCTGDEYVAFSNVPGTTRAITNGSAQGTVPLWAMADEGNCGAVPTTGVCQQVRARNLYPQQLERVYAELITLMPTRDSTAVQVSDNGWNAVDDFGLTPDFTNAMWRIGTMGRNGIATDGVTTYWTFTGATAPATNFTFRFLVQVHGQLVQPTRRATLVGNDDPAADYPARTGGSAENTNIDMTPDGRYVVFTTESPVFLPVGIEGDYVIRHDMITGENLVLNRRSDGSVRNGCRSGNPSISDDGTRVVFWNDNCSLVTPGDPENRIHIYLRDITAGTTSLVDVSTTGSYGNGSAQEPRISADGNVVVFHSSARNLVAGHPPSDGDDREFACQEVFRRDLSTGTTVHISAIDGTPLNDPSGYTPLCGGGATAAGIRPDLSDDGNVIAFLGAQPLVPGDTNGSADVYVYRHDGVTADVFRASETESGGQLPAPTEVQHPSLSGNGAYVTFSTTSTSILASNGRRHVYRRTTSRGDFASVERVTETPTDAQGSGDNGGNPFAVLSPSGRFVAFWSNLNNLGNPYAAPGLNFYVCDMEAPIPVLSRCFVANTYQPSAGSPFVRIDIDAAGTNSRPGMACPDELEGCYVAYIGAPDAAFAPELSGAFHVLVSPFGDPRFQMPLNVPVR